MRIGELARAGAVTTKTIRFYEQVGLLPEPPRSSNGYRDYPHEAPQRLRFIRTAQLAGLTLGEIRDVLTLRDDGHPPCEHVTALIEQRLREVTQRLQDLQLAEAELQALKARAATFTPATCSSTDVCGILSPERS